MKAADQWSSAHATCLAEMTVPEIAESRELSESSECSTKPSISGPLCSAAETCGTPAACNDDKECGATTVAERMAQLVSHDFRNHLAAIYSNVELIAQSKTPDVEREELREEVRAVIWDMTSMLDSFLLLAKTGQPMEPRWDSLHEVVQHAVRMVRAHPDAREVDLSIKDAKHATSIACWMDSTKLGSAIYNLLLNACQAALLGPAPRKVHVTLAENQRFARIRVIDSGCGVPAAIRETLFQPFVSSKSTDSGVGLGLLLVNQTAREHGGYVDLEESSYGRTVFSLYLSKYALETGDGS